MMNKNENLLDYLINHPLEQEQVFAMDSNSLASQILEHHQYLQQLLNRYKVISENYQILNDSALSIPWLEQRGLDNHLATDIALYSFLLDSFDLLEKAQPNYFAQMIDVPEEISLLCQETYKDAKTTSELPKKISLYVLKAVARHLFYKITEPIFQQTEDSLQGYNPTALMHSLKLLIEPLVAFLSEFNF